MAHDTLLRMFPKRFGRHNTWIAVALLAVIALIETATVLGQWPMAAGNEAAPAAESLVKVPFN